MGTIPGLFQVSSFQPSGAPRSGGELRPGLCCAKVTLAQLRPPQGSPATGTFRTDAAGGVGKGGPKTPPPGLATPPWPARPPRRGTSLSPPSQTCQAARRVLGSVQLSEGEEGLSPGVLPQAQPRDLHTSGSQAQDPEGTRRSRERQAQPEVKVRARRLG